MSYFYFIVLPSSGQEKKKREIKELDNIISLKKKSLECECACVPVVFFVCVSC